MSPLNPLPAYTPVVEARQYDYKVGRNLYYLPRGETRISFELLRDVAYSCDLLRLGIETRKDQLCALKWQFKLKIENSDGNDGQEDPRVQELQQFFESPDKNNTWRDWIRTVIEEILVTDALTIYKRFTRGGDLYSLELIDGSTIFPLVDEGGRRPLPPDPAYQQILKGVPKADYTTEELLYKPYTKRVNTVYGYPAVEQIITAAQTEIERMKSQLAYFTDGSYPDVYATMPEGMSPEKILAWEKRVNDMLRGNLLGRRQMPFMPYGVELKELKAPALKDEFDEWLTRKICYALSLPPTAFTKVNNRATAESEKDRAEEEGLSPLMTFIKEIIDDIIKLNFGYDDLEFSWGDQTQQDPKVQSDVLSTYVKAGIMSINEVRDRLGLDPVEGGDEPLALGASGWVPLPGSSVEATINETKMDMATQQAALKPAPAPPGQQEPAKKPTKKPAAKKPAAVKKKFIYAGSQHLH